MRNLLLILIASISIKCTNSDEKLLSSKEWRFNHFVLNELQDNTKNHNPKKIERLIDSINTNQKYRFNNDHTGYVLFNSEKKAFVWSLYKDELKLHFVNNNQIIPYKLNSVNDSVLNMTIAYESFSLEIDNTSVFFKGNLIYK